MFKEKKKRIGVENSLMVQWLGLYSFTAEGVGSIPGWGTKILQAVWCSQKIKITMHTMFRNEI